MSTAADEQAPEHNRPTLDGQEVPDDHALLERVDDHLKARGPSVVSAIAAVLGENPAAVEAVLRSSPDRFKTATGPRAEALGYLPTKTIWQRQEPGR